MDKKETRKKNIYMGCTKSHLEHQPQSSPSSGPLSLVSICVDTDIVGVSEELTSKLDGLWEQLI